MTLKGLVRQNNGRARVFDELRLSYACKGNLSLEQACAERAVDVDRALTALATVDATGPAQTPTWYGLGISELIEHILAAHHKTLPKSMARASRLFEGVAARASVIPNIDRLADQFERVRAELDSHMVKEERVLFPLAEDLSQGQLPKRMSTRMPLVILESEHEDSRLVVGSLRTAFSDWRLPDEASPDETKLADLMAEIEYDLNQHQHKENNLLFDWVRQAESTLRNK